MRIVSATGQLFELFVGHVSHHGHETGISAEEVLAEVGATGNDIFLELAVNNLLHAFDQKTLFVLGQQGIPFGTPDNLDDIPACPAENSFQFLDDLTVCRALVRPAAEDCS